MGIAIYISIPCFMVFLPLVLAPKVGRWTNIVVGVVYAASILVFCIGESWAYYIFLSLEEVVLLAFIVRYAWKWPTSPEHV